MKKKELKQRVRDLEEELDFTRGAVEAATQIGQDLSLREQRARERVAALERQCAATTPVLREAAEHVKQADIFIARHWADVGAFVERARRIEAAAGNLREHLLLNRMQVNGGEDTGTTVYDSDALEAVVNAFDEAAARVAEVSVVPERAKQIEAAGVALRGCLSRFAESAPEKPGFVLYLKNLLDDAMAAFDAAVAGHPAFAACGAEHRPPYGRAALVCVLPKGHAGDHNVPHSAPGGGGTW